MSPKYETPAASGADLGSETLAAGCSDASVFKLSDPDLQRLAEIGVRTCFGLTPSCAHLITVAAGLEGER
jgi:hypothetical protein